MGQDDLRSRSTRRRSAPLEIFGAAATAALREDLEEVGVAGRDRRVVTAHADGALVVEPGGRPLEAAARGRAAARRRARRLPASPTTSAASSAATRHGQVDGPATVWAAGDAIAFPIKQGGLAAQQADAVAEAIAAAPARTSARSRSGRCCAASCSPGAGRRGSRRDGGAEGEAQRHALFWPPTKIAGRYLSPYLAELDRAQAIGEVPQPDGQPIDLDLGVPVDAEHALEPRQEHLHRV